MAASYTHAAASYKQWMAVLLDSASGGPMGAPVRSWFERTNMHQSPQKALARHRDRQVEFDVMEEEAERRSYRAAPPKARKFPLREDSPRAERVARNEPAR